MAIKCSECQHVNPSDTAFCGKCATPLNLSEKLNVSHTMTLETPSGEHARGVIFANRYEIIEALGEGGMGKVLRAYDTKIKEEMALKLLKPEIAGNKKILERFSNEIRLARKITHKNVCRMHDLHEEDGTSFITMEYVPGEDLKSLIYRAERLTIGKALSIAKQVCEGLIEAHSLGVIHRDLKPRNIMIDTNGNAKIMDFGIARSLHDQGMTADGMIVGTPDYISPEQVDGIPVDQRADIYSLGVILFEMLTGTLPFEGLTPISIAVKHKNDPPPIPQKLNPQISGDLNQLILKCLQKPPDSRYQSAKDLLAVLCDIEEGIPTVERVLPKRKTASSKKLTISFSIKKAIVPIVVLMGLICVVIILVPVLLKKAQAPSLSQKPTLAVTYFLNETGEEQYDLFKSVFTRWLITDLSQSQLINVVPMDRLYSVFTNLNLFNISTYGTDDLQNIATEGGANHVVQSTITKLGNSLRVDYSIYELGNSSVINIIASDSILSDTSEVTPDIVDEMTKKIKAHLQLNPSDIEKDIDEEIAEVTTQNPEALQHYTEGDNLYAQGKWKEAIQAFGAATQLDPEFAMAYTKIGGAYWNLYDQPKAAEYYKKALEHRQHIPFKERLMVEARLYGLYEETGKEGLEKYKQGFELYSDDFDFNFNLGFGYLRGEKFDEAILHLEIARELKPANQFANHNLIIAYVIKGQHDKAQDILNFADRHMNIPPFFLRIYFGNIHLAGKNYDLALQEFDKSLAFNPTGLVAKLNKTKIFQLKNEFGRAQEIIQEELEKQNPPPEQLVWRLVRLLVSQGRFQEAAQAAESIFEYHKSEMKGWDYPDYYSDMGVAYVSMGKPKIAFEKFSETVHAIEELQRKSSDENIWVFPVNKRLFLFWQGLALVETERIQDAEKIYSEFGESLPENTVGDIVNNIYRRFIMLKAKLLIAQKDFEASSNILESLVASLPFDDPWGTVGSMNIIYLEALASAYLGKGEYNRALATYGDIQALTTARLKWGNIYAKSYYNMGLIHEQKRDKGKAIKNYEKFLEIWKDADPDIPEIEDAKKRLTALRSQ